MSVLLVGNPQPTHIGGHWLNAARHLDCPASLANVNEASVAPRLVRMLWWHLLGHRPPRLESFSAGLVKRCSIEKPRLVLTTGLAPVSASALAQLRAMGITIANFLTDDPWNRWHRAPWFMKGLRSYHHIFTPRHANEPELHSLQGPVVHYLPFAYAPEIHFPPSLSLDERQKWRSDVLFIGGADAERSGIMTELVRRGLNASLWGGGWLRHPSLRAHVHEHAGPEQFRNLVSCAAVNLCLVRRANRDGHSMRTFELPAVGGCMLVEDTPDHRALFGPDGECVRYFTSIDQMDQQARNLLAAPEEQARLAASVQQRICTEGRNTYADRLQSILQSCAA
ncbi:MAG: hypothetical protein JWO08_2492 [Verrucomicrobiaceae bacterium]|nr:hypothetical protein [Verrucomicrobiaceae bacterium]